MIQFLSLTRSNRGKVYTKKTLFNYYDFCTLEINVIQFKYRSYISKAAFDFAATLDLYYYKVACNCLDVNFHPRTQAQVQLLGWLQLMRNAID